MVVNRQSRVSLRIRALSIFAGRASACLRSGRSHFDVTVVGDSEMKRLNRIFRQKNVTTDVLSFPWNDAAEEGATRNEENFLGDILISAPVAKRNAAFEGHPVETEIKQLILHGLLHLLGYDHEADRGEMDAIEIDLRRRLKIEG